MPKPGLPNEIHVLTRALRASMDASETGDSPTEFRSSFESRPGLRRSMLEVSHVSLEKPLTGNVPF